MSPALHYQLCVAEGECGATDEEEEELDIKPPLLEANNNSTSSNNNNSLPLLGSPQTSVPPLPPPPLHQPLTSPSHGPNLSTSPSILHGGLLVGRPSTPMGGSLGTSSTPTSLHEPLSVGDSKANIALSSYNVSTVNYSDKLLSNLHLTFHYARFSFP